MLIKIHAEVLINCATESNLKYTYGAVYEGYQVL